MVFIHLLESVGLQELKSLVSDHLLGCPFDCCGPCCAIQNTRFLLVGHKLARTSSAYRTYTCNRVLHFSLFLCRSCMRTCPLQQACMYSQSCFCNLCVSPRCPPCVQTCIACRLGCITVIKFIDASRDRFQLMRKHIGGAHITAHCICSAKM